MDQIKIGEFIAFCRKANGFTQLQLAEKLGITDRSVSKWETGKSLPDASLMLELCYLLDINVNELLTGERISQDDYQRKAEENMVQIIKKTTKSVEEKTITIMLSISVFIITIAGCVMGEVFEEPSAKVAILAFSFISMICIIAIWITTTLSLRKNK